jgi:hypothetical protein
MEAKEVINLDDIGRRYDHYMELREIFAEGVEILKNSLAVSHSLTSVVRMKSLQCAVEEVDGRLNTLSGLIRFTDRWSNLAKEVNEIPRTNLLSEGSNGKQVKEVEEQKEKFKPLPPCPNRDQPYRKSSSDEPDCV